MSPTVRWYNRLAAWLCMHDPVVDWIIKLAIPAWQAEAEVDIEELWRWKVEFDEAQNSKYEADDR